MTTPSDPDNEQPTEGVNLAKGDPSSEAPFDPYRFGKPEHPIPAEYAPPGYTGPVIPTAPPPPAGWGAPPPGANPVNPFSNPPGTPYGPYGANPGAQPPPAPYPPPPGQYPPQYGPPPGYYPPTPPQYGYRPQQRAGHGKAITALVLGIGSIVFCWLIFFDVVLVIPGVIFALIAMSETKASGGSGRGMALAGLVCSIIGALLATLLTVLVVHAANQCGGFDNNTAPGFDHCVRDNFF
jgi:Domain of unknown function (DUF4190)